MRAPAQMASEEPLLRGGFSEEGKERARSESAEAVRALCKPSRYHGNDRLLHLRLFARRHGVDGGGLKEEGDDIEVVENTLEEAAAMIANGEIVDAKTVILTQYLSTREQGARSR